VLTHDCLLNFDEINDEVLDTPIYRVFALEKLLTSLNENQLFFVKPRCWDDPYEAFLLKQLIWASDGSDNYPFLDEIKETVYGQCWTFLNESNFLWKIYAPNFDGVIAKSTIRKIIKLFLDSAHGGGQFYLGKVKYMPEQKIKELYENKDTVNQLFTVDALKIIIDSLLVKREEFRQEEEIRLIYHDPNYIIKENEIMKSGYSFDRLHLFNDLTEELVLDPRIDSIRADSITRLIQKLGYRNPIRKSMLFEQPFLKLRIAKQNISEWNPSPASI
jgi:hypothetical protein